MKFVKPQRRQKTYLNFLGYLNRTQKIITQYSFIRNFIFFINIKAQFLRITQVRNPNISICYTLFKFAQNINKLNCKWLKTEAAYNIIMISSAQEEQEIKLPIYESNHSRSVNLNELIRLHRLRQKYQIVDKFYDSYICIQNKLLPNETYYQYDMLRSYLEDLGLVYFKDIELSESVRLQYVLRRLNFTLNGQHFNFMEYLEQNKLLTDMKDLFQKEYLQDVGQIRNEPHVISFRNSIYLCLIIKYLYTISFQNHQISYILQQINDLYMSIKNRIHPQRSLQENQKQIRTKSVTNHSGKREEEDSQDNQVNHQKKEAQEEIKIQEDNGLHFYFEDLIYEEEINLKIIQIQLQNFYFENHLKDENTGEEQSIKLQYLYQINREYLSKLTELRNLNNQNRTIIKKIKANIQLQMNSSTKCIVNRDSSNQKENFGYNLYSYDFHSNQAKQQRLIDAEYMQKTLIGIINKLKYRQIADAIEKVYEIETSQNKNTKSLMFNVSFEKGLGINEAVFGEEQFIALNELREQSLLTSYLTPMKSCYSYISHNVFTFLRLSQNDFVYDKTNNNNYQVMRQIKDKIFKPQKLGGRTNIKRQEYQQNTKICHKQYQQKFKICHNCKILCPKLFLKQCRKRIKNEKDWEESNFQSMDDDSLYTDRNFRSKRNSLSSIECQKNYCIYCIKNNFSGKVFNEKGWCPFCLEACNCSTCLRDKMLKKLIDLYYYVGGDPSKVKTEKEIVQSLQNKSSDEQNDSVGQSHSACFVQYDERVYQSIIKKEIMKGFSAEEIEASLSQQKQIIIMVLKRENLKLRSLQCQFSLFRKKLSQFNVTYQHIDEEAKQEKRALEQQRKARREREKEEYNQKMLAKRRRSKRSISKDDERRNGRKIITRDQQIYYDYYQYDKQASEYDESSSFHINLNKTKQKNYEPYYTF